MAANDAAERVATPVANPPPADSPFGIWSTETAKDKGYKVLLYGASGSGKTYMAGTFPDPIFLDLEDGMRTLLPLGRKVLRYPKDPSRSITDFKEVRDFYRLVRNTPVEQAPFKTVVIDSLNELQVLILKNLLSQYAANRQYDDQPTMADYGKLARDMQAVVRQFLQLPYHVVMTATASDREYEEEKVFPMFIGKKTGPDLRRIIEQIGFCFTQQRKDGPIEHMVGFEDCPAYIAKDRTGSLKLPIINTYQAMQSVVNSNGKGK